MTSYLEQSAQAFLEMQQQLQKQARNLFGAFPFPNFGAAFAELRGRKTRPPRVAARGAGGSDRKS